MYDKSMENSKCLALLDMGLFVKGFKSIVKNAYLTDSQL